MMQLHAGPRPVAPSRSPLDVLWDIVETAETWKRHAHCAGSPLNPFSKSAAMQARFVAEHCDQCQVVGECLEANYRADSSVAGQYGVVGGLMPEQRRRRLRQDQTWDKATLRMLEVLELNRHREYSVGELAAKTRASRRTVHRGLSVLLAAGQVTRREAYVGVRYQLADGRRV